MAGIPAQGIFVTGSNTEVGKTFVACLIAKWIRSVAGSVAVYKPVASGGVRENGSVICDDAFQLWQAAGCPLSLDEVCPQMFSAAIAPHLAARQEGRQVDNRLLFDGLQKWHRFPFVVVEGAGGWMSPVSDEHYVADVAVRFGYPILIVVPNCLGAINQSLTTLHAIRAYAPQLPIAGVVLNEVSSPAVGDASRSSNLDQLQRRAAVPLVVSCGHGQSEFDRSTMRAMTSYDPQR